MNMDPPWLQLQSRNAVRQHTPLLAGACQQKPERLLTSHLDTIATPIALALPGLQRCNANRRPKMPLCLQDQEQPMAIGLRSTFHILQLTQSKMVMQHV